MKCSKSLSGKMLKRVKRKTSKQHCTAEKTEDVSLNSNKNGVPSEVELLQQVTAELKAELNTLKEQLEREKKNSTEMKSLKTQQVCTLTFKLANAVRQRERAEDELAKIQKEMEELKEVIKSQEEKLKGRSLRDAEYEKKDTKTERELVNSKETGDFEESLKINGEESKGAIVEGLTDEYLASKTEYCTEDTSVVDQQVKKNGELKKVLETQEKEATVIESREPDENSPEHLYSKETPEEKEDESDLLSELEVNGNDSRCLEPIKNEGEKLLIENSSPENSPQEETTNGDDSQSEVSPISSLALSGFESWKGKSSFPENSEESFHLEDWKNTSSEICFSSCANSSLETCDEFTESLTKPDNDEGKISESGNPPSARKNRRMRSLNSEDQESSPPTSPDDDSVVYLSESANLLEHRGMAEDHSVAVHPRNYQKVHEANPSRLGGVKETEKRGLEGFYSKPQQSTSKETICQNTKNFDSPHKSLELGQWKQDTSSSQDVSEDVKELREQLKSALKEIKELRLENKEMKKEMRKLSTSAEENAFLVKTTQFTDRLLRDMREREGKVHAQRAHSTCETYGLEGDFSYSRNPEVRSMRWLTSAQRRSDECPNRLTQSKLSLSSLKVLGAKLKEITRSVENMAMDPELHRETLRQPSLAPDLSYYNQSTPSSTPLNDHLRIGEQLIIPASSSERLSTVQSVLIDQETSREPSAVAHTAVEKLGEEENLVPSNTQYLLTEKDSVWRDKTFQITDHAPDMKGSEGCTGNWHQDTKDHIQRYIVRSSDYIAKLRDLKPEELAVDSKFR